jgi:hypothetical protein
MAHNFENALTETIAGFLLEIGIEIVATRLPVETFLPGIMVDEGRLLVDESKLTYPGDLLHEAAHLAVAPSQFRSKLSGEVVVPGMDIDALEVQAIAWSYAATRHLGIAPEIVFHSGGYKGKSEGIIFTYGCGVYPGVHHLQALGMTATGDLARQSGVQPYPHMIKWLRD